MIWENVCEHAAAATEHIGPFVVSPNYRIGGLDQRSWLTATS
jgi:hypothetical protein